MMAVFHTMPGFQAVAQSDNLFVELLPWLGLLLAVVVIGGVAVLAARKRAFGDDSSASAGGFTLHDLRQLHGSGELSDEEFERARDRMIGRIRSEAIPEDDATESAIDDAPDSASGPDGQSDSDSPEQ